MRFQSNITRQVNEATEANLTQRQATAAAFRDQYNISKARKRGGHARETEEPPTQDEYVSGIDPLAQSRTDIPTTVTAMSAAYPKEHTLATAVAIALPGLSVFDVSTNYLHGGLNQDQLNPAPIIIRNSYKRTAR